MTEKQGKSKGRGTGTLIDEHGRPASVTDDHAGVSGMGVEIIDLMLPA